MILTFPILHEQWGGNAVVLRNLLNHRLDDVFERLCLLDTLHRKAIDVQHKELRRLRCWCLGLLRLRSRRYLGLDLRSRRYLRLLCHHKVWDRGVAVNLSVFAKAKCSLRQEASLLDVVRTDSLQVECSTHQGAGGNRTYDGHVTVTHVAKQLIGGS